MTEMSSKHCACDMHAKPLLLSTKSEKESGPRNPSIFGVIFCQLFSEKLDLSNLSGFSSQDK